MADDDVIRKPDVYVFHQDPWTTGVISTHARELNGILDAPTLLLDTKDATNIPIRNTLPSLNGYGLDTDSIIRYDMHVVMHDLPNIINFICPQTDPPSDVRTRIISFINYTVEKFKKVLQESNVKGLVVLLPMLGARMFLCEVCYSLRIPVASINLSPFRKLKLIDDGSLTQTGSLASPALWERIKRIKFAPKEEEYYENWRENFIADRSTRGSNEDTPGGLKTDLPTNFILLLGQSPGDANQAIHQRRSIPYSPISVIHKLLLLFPDKEIVFKKHPEDTSNECERISALRSPNIIISEENANIHHFLPNASHVVTWNSNAGVEALLYDKKIAVLGHAFYRNKEITFDAENLDSLAGFASYEPNLDLVRQFLMALVCRILIPSTDYKRIGQRMMDIMQNRLWIGA